MQPATAHARLSETRRHHVRHQAKSSRNRHSRSRSRNRGPRHSLRGLRPFPRHPARVIGPGLRSSDADPGENNSDRATGPRRHGRGADRHRQNRWLLTADHSVAACACQCQRLAGASSGARPDPDADTRTGRPGRGKRESLLAPYTAAIRRRFRRRGHGAANCGTPLRYRNRHRHAGTPARSR